jgi:two-component system alkaline phosphatase synthesis response regulator PhoP
VSPATPGFRLALLVEDEAALAQAIALALGKLGIPHRHVTLLSEAERMVWSESPDLILLDRMLPDGEGLELCRKLRDQGYAGSILVLSALGDATERVEGLEIGADDYLPKPFSWEELSARVRALARRRPPAAAAATSTPLWSLDADRLRVLGPKGWVEVTQLEFKLLGHLIAAPGAALSREELLKDVWGFQWLPKTRTVDFFMGRLRKNFELDPDNPSHFVTVRGIGYRFDP